MRRLRRPTWQLPRGAWGPGGSTRLPAFSLLVVPGSAELRHPSPLCAPAGSPLLLGDRRHPLRLETSPSDGSGLPAGSTVPGAGVAERAVNGAVSAAWFSGTVVLGSGVTWLHLMARQRASSCVTHHTPQSPRGLARHSAFHQPEEGSRALEPRHMGASSGAWAGR